MLLAGVVVGWYAKEDSYRLDIKQESSVTEAGGAYEITIIKPTETYTLTGHNTFMTIGKRFERNLKFFHNVTQNATTGYLGYVSLSNDASPAATWTQLAGEASTAGATRKAWDSLVVLNSTSVNGTVTFSFTGSITLQCVGIQWDSHSLYNNNLYAAFAFSSTSFISGDSLIVKYYHQTGGT